MAVEQPQPSEPSVDLAVRPAGARAPRPVEHPDTVADAAATPERVMPHRELGLKDEEYASIKELLGRRPTNTELAKPVAGPHVAPGRPGRRRGGAGPAHPRPGRRHRHLRRQIRGRRRSLDRKSVV